MAINSCRCRSPRTWWGTSSANSRRPGPSPVTRPTRRRSGANMSKPKHIRLLAETEAQAVLRNVRVSPRKLNLVAGLIRNRTAADAVATLTFSKPRIAQDVRKTLESAIPNAENNHQLDVHRLVVSRAEAGQAGVTRPVH